MRGWPLDLYSGCRKFLEKNRWYHIAVVHNLQDKNFMIFVNGFGTSFSNKDWIAKLWDAASFNTMSDSIEFVMKGVGEAEIDEFRISNIKRYRNGFRPNRQRHQHDKNTIILLPFDE